MKKRILSIFLVGTLCCSLLVGCGGKETPETSVEKEEVSSSSEVVAKGEETLKSDEDIMDDLLINVAPEFSTSSSEPVFEIEEEEKLEIEEFVDSTIQKDENEKEFVDFASLEEVEKIDGLYDNVDVTTLMPSDKVEISMDFEGVMKMIIGTAEKNVYTLISTNLVEYEMYSIGDMMYSHLNSIAEGAESYSYAKITGEGSMTVSDDMGVAEYNSDNVKEVNYVKALKDTDGTIYDVLEVKVDPREEDEKDMLAYETPDGIMYLDKDSTMTMNGVTYGGEDGVQPLDEVPLEAHLFYIERNTGKLRGLGYETDGIPVVAHINDLEKVILPEEFGDAVEVTEDEIGMEMFGVVMMAMMPLLESAGNQ